MLSRWPTVLGSTQNPRSVIASAMSVEMTASNVVADELPSLAGRSNDGVKFTQPNAVTGRPNQMPQQNGVVIERGPPIGRARAHGVCEPRSVDSARASADRSAAPASRTASSCYAAMAAVFALPKFRPARVGLGADTSISTDAAAGKCPSRMQPAVPPSPLIKSGTSPASSR
jgi:hypothetical protein